MKSISGGLVFVLDELKPTPRCPKGHAARNVVRDDTDGHWWTCKRCGKSWRRDGDYKKLTVSFTTPSAELPDIKAMMEYILHSVNVQTGSNFKLAFDKNKAIKELGYETQT